MMKSPLSPVSPVSQRSVDKVNKVLGRGLVAWQCLSHYQTNKGFQHLAEYREEDDVPGIHQ